MKLLVVDDEPLILNGIIRMIRNANTPFLEIVGAADGIDALEKLEQYVPDLILTDIHMPEMDGLALIKEALERNLCDRFVILTGYGDFAYARQAIRYQVIDYLLKPINKEELIAVLFKVAETIREERERSRELSLLLLKEHMLYNTPLEEVPFAQEQLERLLPLPVTTVIVIQANEGGPSERLAEIRQALAGAGSESYTLHARFLGQAVLIANGTRSLTEEQWQQACGSRFDGQPGSRSGFCIGVSGRECGPESVRELYIEAMAAMFFNRYFFSCSMTVYRAKGEPFDLHDTYDNLVRQIELAGEQPLTVEQIKKDMQPILRYFAGDAFGESKLREQFLVCVGVYLQSFGLTPEAVWGEQAAGELFKSGGFPMDDAQAAELVSQLIRGVRRTDQRQPYMQAIDKITAFVSANYMRDLSLDAVADHVRMHPNYISMLFRKEMGMTFLHYLHTFRLSKAKQYMQDHPDMPLHTIAESVGYENTRHFFKVFKKFENVTPGQYRLGGSFG